MEKWRGDVANWPNIYKLYMFFTDFHVLYTCSSLNLFVQSIVAAWERERVCVLLINQNPWIACCHASNCYFNGLSVLETCKMIDVEAIWFEEKRSRHFSTKTHIVLAYFCSCCTGCFLIRDCYHEFGCVFSKNTEPHKIKLIKQNLSSPNKRH